MDAEIAPTEIIEEFNALLEAGDFDGAEELLSSAIGSSPKRKPISIFNSVVFIRVGINLLQRPTTPIRLRALRR